MTHFKFNDAVRIRLTNAVYTVDLFLHYSVEYVGKLHLIDLLILSPSDFQLYNYNRQLNIPWNIW